MKLTWQDTDEIAWALAEEHPGLDPLTLSLSRLQQMTRALDDFDDPSEPGDETVLEAIPAAWHEATQP
jgi:FeS assembly protein IscX